MDVIMQSISRLSQANIDVRDSTPYFAAISKRITRQASQISAPTITSEIGPAILALDHPASLENKATTVSRTVIQHCVNGLTTIKLRLPDQIAPQMSEENRSMLFQVFLDAHDEIAQAKAKLSKQNRDDVAELRANAEEMVLDVAQHVKALEDEGEFPIYVDNRASTSDVQCSQFSTKNML